MVIDKSALENLSLEELQEQTKKAKVMHRLVSSVWLVFAALGMIDAVYRLLEGGSFLRLFPFFVMMVMAMIGNIYPALENRERVEQELSKRSRS